MILEADCRTQIAYHDYLLLGIGVDAEWSRKGAYDPSNDPTLSFSKAFQEIENLNRNYAERIENNYRKLRGVKQSEELDDYLFKPISFLPIGHSDALSLTLVDDLDPVHYITSMYSSTIEDVDLAFCPELSSLGIETEGTPFFPPHELFECLASTDPLGTPLVSLSKFKLDGLANIGHALLFQQELYKAMAERIEETLQCLLRCQDELIENSAEYYSVSDIENLKCCFLDLQGQEEIGLLVFCKNYTVSTSVVSAMHSLTYNDVLGRNPLLEYPFEANNLRSYKKRNSQELFEGELTKIEELDGDDGKKIRFLFRTPGDELKWCDSEEFEDPDEIRKSSLWPVYERSIPHKDVIDSYNDLNPDRRKHFQSIGANHAFRWGNSTVGIRAEAFQGVVEKGDDIDKDEIVSGNIEAITQLHFSAGHRETFEDLGKLPKIESIDRAGKTKSPSLLHARRHSIGNHDLLTPLGREQFSSDYVVPTSSFFREAHKLMSNKVGKNEGKSERRDLVGMSSLITVPIPSHLQDSLNGAIGNDHFTPLNRILPKLKNKIFPPSVHTRDDEPDEEAGDLTRAEGPLSIQKIVVTTELFGFPTALRRTIIYLYQTLSSVLSNPFIYDTLLDLYDVFVAFHKVFTVDIPKQVEKESAEKQRCVDLPEYRVKQISMFVDALQVAVRHRLYRVFPETTIRDTSVDFRGGFNQLIFAADAPLKCSLGILRNNVLDCEPHRSTVGVLTRIGFQPGMKVESLNLGTEETKSADGRVGTRLAYFEGDVPHLLQVSTFIDYVHESAHLIFDEYHQNQGFLRFVDAIDDPLTYERVSEIFVNFLTLQLVCPEDPERYFIYYIARYSESLRSVQGDDFEMIVDFSEVFSRLFIVKYLGLAVNEVLNGSERYDVEFPLQKMIWDLDTVFKDFRSCIKEYGPLFFEFQEICELGYEDEVLEFTIEQFEQSYYKFRFSLAAIYGKTMDVIREFRKVARERCLNSLNSVETKLDSVVEEAFKQGRPLSRSVFELRNLDACDRGVREDGGRNEPVEIHSAILVFALLKGYMGRVDSFRKRDGSFKKIHLPRTSKGVVSFEPQDGSGKGLDYSEEYSDFLVHRGAASMFSCVPRKRRERLLSQISVIKSLWGISSYTRGRRLSDLLNLQKD